MNSLVNFLFGGTYTPSASRASAEQEEINLAVALSLSEPASDSPVEEPKPVVTVEETSNDQAIARALVSSSEHDKKNDVLTAPTEIDAEMEATIARRSFEAIPGDLRNSLMILQDNENDGKAVADALQHEDVLVSSSNFEAAAHYDEKIEKKVSRFRLPSMKAIFYPSVNRETSEDTDRDSYRDSKKRLKERLANYTLVEYTIAGDGNCQFGSLSDQLYRTPKLAGVIRAMVVKHLRSEAEKYSRFVPGDYNEYCDKMEKNGIWGDHLTLQAAADRYGTQINLITSYKDTPFVEIYPQGELKSSRILWLSFFGELHYNSLYTHEDIDNRRKMDRPMSTDCVLF